VGVRVALEDWEGEDRRILLVGMVAGTSSSDDKEL
jgi:hypothetical protein